MTRGRAGERAVIVGAGMAGLLAARVVSDHFRDVVVVEREELPDGPDCRRKTPQSIHSHILGALGYRVVEELFPGLDAELAAHDAPAFDYLGDCVYVSTRELPRFRSGLNSRMCSRPLLEWTMRRALLERDNVTVRDRFRVSALRTTAGRVDGIIGRVDNRSTTLSADLVVDAAGIGSRTPAWLEQAGFGTPEAVGIDLRGGTTTRLFELPRAAWPDWVALFVRMTDDNPRQAALARIEHGLWRVSMSGLGGVFPPKHEDGFLAFAAQLPSRALHDRIATATPVSPVYYYGNSKSRWMRYDHMSHFPDGLVVLGDAVFHPNSEHAQGMAFCALGAVALGQALSQSERPLGEREGFSAAFQRALADAQEPYWTWNNAVEMAIPGVRGPTPSAREQRLHRFYGAVRAVAPCDPTLLRTAVQITQGERHPFALFHPALALRALALASERGA